MPVGIKELSPKKKMPLPKPKPRHANPKHPMNAEKTKPLGKAVGGTMPPPPSKGMPRVPKEFMGTRPMESKAADKKRSRRGSAKSVPSTGMAGGGSVKVGERGTAKTLSQIAADNNVSLRDLLSANPSIKNANKIRLGQSIKLPSTKMTGSSIGATRNPYKSMSKKDMSDLDVKNKSAKRQESVTKRSRVSAMDELKAKAKAPKPQPKLGEVKADSVETKKQKASRTGSIKSATTAENSRLEAIRQKARGRADRRMGGGTMKKKVQGYKNGGSVCRGGGAATKGKRFGRSG